MVKKSISIICVMMLMLLFGCDNNKGPFVKRKENGRIVLYANDKPASGWVTNYVKDKDDIEVKVSEIRFQNGVPVGDFRFFDETGTEYLDGKMMLQGDLYHGNMVITYDKNKKIKLNGDFTLSSNWILQGENEFIINEFKSPQELADWLFANNCKTGSFESPFLKAHLKDGLKDGEWEYYDADGKLVLKGTFKDGKRNGIWEEKLQISALISRLDYQPERGEQIISGDNLVVDTKGTYKDDLPDGEWTYLDEKGNPVLIGTFKEGKITGPWKFYDGNGIMVAVGNYVNGVKEGDWTYYNNEGGVIAVGPYHQGYREGMWQELMSEGSVGVVENGIYKFLRDIGNVEENPNPEVIEASMEKYDQLKAKSDGTNMSCIGPYEKGKMQGAWQCRTIKNETIVVSFAKGQMDGIWQCYNKDNLLIIDGTYRNGKIDGQWKLFYENGKLGIQANYDQNVLNGDWKLYFQNGKIIFSGYFDKGIPSGTWQYFGESGRVIAKATFQNGKREERGDFSRYLKELIKVMR